MTLGVEEEFFIIDRTTQALAPRSDRLVEVASEVLGDSVTHELNLCQIEIASSVCHTTDELRDDLVRLRTGLGEAAMSMDHAIIASGTHPFSSWEDQEVNAGFDRYKRMEQRYQAVARQQIICGCHVHVGIEDQELAIEVMNRARPWLPTLLALSANSPYWHGVDTGFDSYRTQVWQRWPTSGMPPYMSSRAEYDALIDELESVGAIEDATYLYWYVRPSVRWPTVEFRPCDVCLDVDDAVAVGAIMRSLAWSCARDALAGVDTSMRSCEATNASIWRAARYGIGEELVDAEAPMVRPASEAVKGLLNYIADGLEAHGDTELVTNQVETIMRRGNGATAQRTAQADAYGELSGVVDLLVDRTLQS